MNRGQQNPNPLGQYNSLEAGLRLLAGYIVKYPNSCTDLKKEYTDKEASLKKLRAELLEQGFLVKGITNLVLESLIADFNKKTLEANSLYKIIEQDFNKRIPEQDKYFELCDQLDSLLAKIRAEGYNPTKEEILKGIASSK
jgi:hypothetical protein